jgi:glycosyltransferase involved in cell wall biosynthesis
MTLAIYIPAYNAERFVTQVLRRIPNSVLARTAEIVLVDNASTDRTSEVASATAQELGWTNFTLIRNPTNLGYGGSQKVAYAHCIARGHKTVVMLHADGQYAPELLDRISGPVERDEADMCFGSRLAGDPLAGNMPLLRYLGNKFLTGLANLALGWRLSEYHSGYRAYRCEALARLPLERNAGYYHFDVEILIQCKVFGLRVVERPIPTHYGDEENHLNVWRTGFSILAILFEYLLHRTGVRSCAKYMERAN